MSDAVTVDDQGLTSAFPDPEANNVDHNRRGREHQKGRIRRRVGLILKIVVTVAVVGWITKDLARTWPDAKRAWESLTLGSLVLSTVAVLLGLAASSAAWRAAVKDIGSPTSFSAALRVFVIGQVAKYVPGTVWVYLLQTELGHRAGVPRARGFLASLMAMAIGIIAALMVGAAGMYSMIASSDPAIPPSVVVGSYIAIALLPLGLICMVPRVMTVLVSTALKIMRQPALDAPLTWNGILKVFLWSIAAWACFGAHLWLLVNANADPGLVGYFRCVGAGAVAISLAMFAPTPSGVGVREKILALLIVSFFAGNGISGIALGTAFVSRIIFTIAELVGAGFAALTDVSGIRGRAGISKD